MSLIDLEDSVSSSNKATAHIQVERLLRDRKSVSPVFVRSNPLGSTWFEDDIACAIRASGICLPKVDGVEYIDEVNARLESHEVRTGKTVGTTSLLIAIESPEGLTNVDQIARRHRRIVGLIFGAEDYGLALGLPRSGEGVTKALTHAQCRLVVAAKAARIQAIDGVYINVRDLDGQRIRCVRAREMGFTGVAAAHPSQAQVIDEVFEPSPQEIYQAKRIVSAFESSIEQESGVFTLDGSMIDYPIAARAAWTLVEAGMTDPPNWLDQSIL